MTGQGDRNFDRIQEARSTKASFCIDIHKEYRTASNHRVRGLKKMTTNKILKNGVVVELANYHTMISGQVYMRDVFHNDAFGWVDQMWEEDGSHLLSELALQVYHQPVVKQESLFA